MATAKKATAKKSAAKKAPAKKSAAKKAPAKKAGAKKAAEEGEEGPPRRLLPRRPGQEGREEGACEKGGQEGPCQEGGQEGGCEEGGQEGACQEGAREEGACGTGARRGPCRAGEDVAEPSSGVAVPDGQEALSRRRSPSVDRTRLRPGFFIVPESRLRHAGCRRSRGSARPAERNVLGARPRRGRFDVPGALRLTWVSVKAGAAHRAPSSAIRSDVFACKVCCGKSGALSPL